MANYTVDELIAGMQAGTITPMQKGMVLTDWQNFRSVAGGGGIDSGVGKPETKATVVQHTSNTVQQVDYNDNHIPVTATNSIPSTPVVNPVTPEVVLPGYNDNIVTSQDIPSYLETVPTSAMITGVTGIGTDDSAVLSGMIKYAKYGAIFIGVVMVLNLLRGRRR